MAGTIGDNSTDGYWWLADALAYIGEYVDTEKQAEELLCTGADGHISWRCKSVMVDEKHSPVETPPAAAARFFWRRYEDSHIEFVFDRQTNCVHRRGPVVRLGFDGVGNVWPRPDTSITSTWTAYLVRFHHGDVVAYLVARGLMPRPPAPSSPAQEAVPTPLPEEFEDKTTSTTEPSFPTLETLGLKGWRQEQIWEVASQIYSKGIPEKLKAADLCDEVEKTRIAKARAGGDKPPKDHPSPDTCEDFLAAYRAWSAKQRTAPPPIAS